MEKVTEKEFNEANKKAEFLKEYCSRIIEKSKNKNLTLENTPKALFKVVEIDMFVEDIIKENEKLKNEGKDNKKLIERTELLIKIIKSIIKDPLLKKEYKDIYEYFNSQLTLLFESKILIKTEPQPPPIIESPFSVLEWATIFYYADETKLLSESRLLKTRLEQFMSKHQVNTTPVNFKNSYYEAKRRINKMNDYPINKLELIIPFLKENYKQTVTKVENDIIFLEENKPDY